MLGALAKNTEAGVDYFGLLQLGMGKKRKRMVLSVHMYNYESGSCRSGTQIGYSFFSQCNLLREVRKPSKFNNDKETIFMRIERVYVAAWNTEGIEIY